MKRPSLNALRTFEAAGRCLSFSAAADDLNISQAAVSQQIRKLEDYLGCELFLRQHRRLVLTSRGQAYYQVVHETIDRLNNITDQLFPHDQHSLVTISCSPSIATLWLVPHISTIKNAHPDIEIRVNTLDYLSDSSVSKSDFEIRVQAVPDKTKTTHKLMSVQITPVCAPELLNKVLEIKSSSDLLEYPLIHVLGYDDDWYRWFKHFKVKHGLLTGGLSFDASLMAVEATIRGEGIMLGRRPFVDGYLKTGELVEIFEQPKYLQTHCYLYSSDNKKMTRNEKIITNWLKKIGAES